VDEECSPVVDFAREVEADVGEEVEVAGVPATARVRDAIAVRTGRYRPISVYHFPRGALTLCPQLCMGIQPGARFPARSADAMSATLYGHFTQAIYRNRPVARYVIDTPVNPGLLH
jgi:hypothetical protein